MELWSVFILWLRPAFWSRDVTMYLVLSAFTSNPLSLVATTKASYAWLHCSVHCYSFRITYFCVVLHLARSFLISKSSGTALGHSRPSVQCVPVVFFQAWIIRSVTLTTHVHLVPRLRISGVLLLLPSTYLHVVDRDKYIFITWHVEVNKPMPTFHWTGLNTTHFS